MFNPSAFENSRAEGIAALEIEHGPEVVADQPRLFVPLRRTELRGEVTGPLASLRLTQVYGYSREQCDREVEAVYRFPLPGDAAVTGVRVRFGAVEIHTELKERPEAEADYQKAREEGRQAALLTRESPDVFTLRVVGIKPDQEVTVETAYVQLARAEGSGWSLRIPLTTSPRYVRGDELTARHAQGQPLALLRDPGHRVSLDLTLSGAGAVSSPTHALDLAEQEDRTRVRLKDGEVVPDRDCILSWQPKQERDRLTFHVWLHDDKPAQQVYFLALVAPPAVPDPGNGIAREVILLVDHSGSMEGAKWAAADWAVKKFVSELTERDAFNLGLFHNTTRWLWEKPRPVDADAVKAAIQFLEAHKDSGGTELGVALEQALSQPRSAGEMARHVLVITDAEVSDAGRILRLADQEAKQKERRRISDLCIDAAPNSFLAQELAERGGGIARFLTSDPEQEDITTALDEVLADWAQPVLVGLQVEVNRPQVQAAGREVASAGEEDRSRIDLGDLPTGRAVWVAGRVPRSNGDDLAFRVLAAPGREVKARHLSLSAETRGRPALKALFGARQILGLEYLIHSASSGEERSDQLRRLGYDPAEVFAGDASKQAKVYAENARAESEAALKKLLVQESLSYGLISSETAFVAVRKEAGKPVQETVVVANALPAGWSERFLTGAQFYGGAPRAMALRATRAAGPAPSFALLANSVAEDLEGAALSAVAGAPCSPSAAPAGTDLAVLFAGAPSFANGAAMLFDSSQTGNAGKLPDSETLTRLQVRFPGGAPKPESIDPGLALLIFVEDLSEPRARVRLSDLIRQGGERPLNLRRRPGQRVRVELVDPAGAWASGAPAIEVALG
jgi:Ca-activated chloride channel family protein